MTIQEWFKNGVQYDSEGTQIWAVEKTFYEEEIKEDVQF